MTHHTFNAMGSPCALTILGHGESKTQTLMNLAVNEIQRLEDKFSRYKPCSLTAQINSQAGVNKVKCDRETAELIDFAFQAYLSSDGHFDITSGVFRKIWDFKRPQIPNQDQILRTLELVGMNHVDWDGENIFLRKKNMELDFGGLVKEYAADRVALMLFNAGAKSSLINLSGDLMATGPKPNGKPWRIGIKHPKHPNQLLATFNLGFGGLASSGDYERSFVLNSVRYGHLLDAKTGWPVQHWQTVSVAANSCLTAGTHSSCAMLLEERGLDYLRKAQVAFCAMDRQDRVFHD